MTLYDSLWTAGVDVERDMEETVRFSDGPALDLARPDANVLTLSMP